MIIVPLITYMLSDWVISTILCTKLSVKEMYLVNVRRTLGLNFCECTVSCIKESCMVQILLLCCFRLQFIEFSAFFMHRSYECTLVGRPRQLYEE